jgi:hypothetical protein
MRFIPFFLFILSPVAFAEWKFSGNAGPYINSLTLPSTTVSPAQKSGLQTEMRLDNKYSSTTRLKAELWMRTDFIAKDGVESFQWNPKNLYLQKKTGPLVFRAGFQTLSIDGPDIVNPADVIHSKNWIDPTSPVTYSSLGLSASQEIGKWNWEVFYVPEQTRPVLPGEHSPWLPRKNRLPVESNTTEFRIPDNVRYQYLHSKEIQNSLHNNISLKIQRKSEKLETQFVYYNGLNQSPYLLTQVDASLIASQPKQILLVNSPVHLVPLYYRHQVVAGTFTIPLGSVALKGGANWYKPMSDSRVPGETSTVVGAIEKNLETSFGMITFIAEYIRQKRQVESQINFLRSFFQEAISVGTRVPVGEETTFLLGGIFDQRGHSSIYKFSVNRRITNSWSADASAQYLQGPSSTLVGLYGRYDSYRVSAVYSW